MNEEIYDSYLDSLLTGDHNTCRQLVRKLLETDIPIRELYVHLFQRSLYEVGELWEQNKISVATEHLATAVTERMMAEVYPHLFRQPHQKKSALVACPTEEYHQIGAQMVADVFELNGWDGYFTGANTPRNDLYRMIEEKKPDVVALSVSLSFHVPSLLDVVAELNSKYPELPIWVGGQAFRWGNAEALQPFKNVHYLCDLYTLEKMLQQ